jgi:ribosomal protein S18 acetylase RimI-like enzyme
MLSVRARDRRDDDAVAALLARAWGSTQIATRGRLVDAATLDGLVACDGEAVVGLATFEVRDGSMELVTLNATEPGAGVGSLLLDAVRREARERAVRRLWLATTNDNVAAIRFYARHGGRVVAVHAGAVARARELKASIPLVAADGTPITDEVEIELPCNAGRPRGTTT